jgi:hypothetical protein
MASVVTPLVYRVASGQPVNVGRYPGGKFAGLQALSDAVMSGGFSVTAVTPPPPPPSPQAGLPQVALQSATSGSKAFAVGFTFRQGDIPGGQGVVVSGAAARASVMTRWPDGSVRFAIIAGTYTSVGGTPSTLTMSAGTVTAGAALTASVVQTAMGAATAVVNCGAFGSVTFSGSDFASPFATHFTNDLGAEFIYRKQVGADAHLAAWLHIRAWPDGQLEFLPVVENGYLQVSGPTTKNEVFSFTLNGTTLFSDRVGVDVVTQSYSGTGFTTKSPVRGVNPFRVRVGALSGDATWVSTDGNGLSTFTVAWDGATPGSAPTVTVLGLPHHCRTPLLSGSALSYWLGVDPGVSALHDRAYMQATEVVPTYYATIDPSNAQVATLPASFTPLQAGSFAYSDDFMGGTGFASPIGLLPQHDAVYLMASSGVWASVQRNGYSVGRYPIHWRDETTNRPPILASYPNLVIGPSQGVTNTGSSTTSSYTPAVTGTAPPAWDLAHCPSVGFMAYLLTGRYYFLEEMQFAAVTNSLLQDDVIRDGGVGAVWHYPDTRHGAWAIRTLMQAQVMTTDSDTAQKNNFKAALQGTIDKFHSRYVAQAHNPLGYTEPGADYFGSQSSTYGDRLFMQDFSVGSWGYMLAAQPVLDSGYAAKIAAFFNWHAPATIGRLGDPDDATAWPVNNPAHYNGAVAPSDAPDWAGGTGPWYANFRAAYNATILTPPGWLSTNKLLLGAEILPGANSFLGNMLPAIAYAVRHGVTGAKEGLRRLMALEGFGRLMLDLQTTAVWGVKPASGALPTWLTANPFVWNEIPTSTLAGSAAGIGSTPGDATAQTTRLLAFSGISKRKAEVWTIATGGHNDNADNGARMLDISADSPAWTYPKASDWNGSENTVAYYASGSPASRHSHRSTFWVPQRSRFLLVGCRATWGGSAASFNDVASFNPATSAYDPQGTRAAPICAINAFDPVTGIGLGSYTSSGGQIVRFNATADTHTITAGGSIGYMPTGAYDSKRGEFYYLGWGDGEAGGSGVVSRKVSSSGATVTNITLTGTGATAFAAAAPSYGTMVYDPVVDCYWWWDGVSRQLFKIVPTSSTSWACTVQTISGTPPVVAQYSFSRMEYIAELGGLVFMPTGAHPLQFVRTF